MLDFDFTEADKKKYYKKAKERLDKAGVTFLEPDYNAIGARGWDCTTKKADVVIVHLISYRKDKFTRQKEAMCKKIKGWRKTKDAAPVKTKGWSETNMTHEAPDYWIHSRIEFTDGRGRHGTKG